MIVLCSSPGMNTLRSKVIRLAHENPALRPHLLPLLKTAARPIHEIAGEIARLWKPVNFAAKPYLEAMMSLNSINDDYGADSGRSIVSYFLVNSSGFRGPDAKRIKAELKAMLK